MKLKNQDLNKMPFNNVGERFREFNSFWGDFIDLVAKSPAQKKSLKEQPTEFRMKSQELMVEVNEYRHFLNTISIVSAIGAWIEERLTDANWKERYANSIAKLNQKSILPFHNTKGTLVTLDYFIKHGHLNILEAIRCESDWAPLEKEENVSVYVQFTQSLAHNTQGLVPYATDPDRERARNKAIKYEVFIDFVNHLSERDALMAKVLYFGARTIEEVITLTPDAIDAKTSTILLGGAPTNYPQHIILDLLAYIKQKPKAQKILFTNLRGELVERPHLNQSFARACEKMAKKEKITPGALLKYEHEAKSSD